MARFQARRATTVGIIVAAAVALVAGCSSSGSSGSQIALVAYSTPQQAYGALIPAFQQTGAGKGVTFSQSYGASGAQSRAVIAGLKADVVEMSLEPDVAKLVKAGLVSSGWNGDTYKGMITDSVAVFVVRKGNPKHIKSWDDLIKPGIKVVTPNPFSSGSAQWNIMAAYGAQLKEGKTGTHGLAYLGKLFANVVAQDKSGRDALNTFTSGTGDVLISYENEAIAAQQSGKSVDYVIPADTILIENPIAVTKNAPGAAQKFVTYLHTDAAQKIFASKGYRPVVKADLNAVRFPTPAGLFTIDALGGWTSVQTKFFDPDKGLMVGIEKSVGVSAGK